MQTSQQQLIDEKDISWVHDEEFKVWLHRLRLVSRDFNRIITPIVYRHIDATKYSFMDQLANVSGAQVSIIRKFLFTKDPISMICMLMLILGNIVSFARRIKFPVDVKANTRNLTARLVAACRKLELVR
jgi:hypothetical protein